MLTGQCGNNVRNSVARSVGCTEKMQSKGWGAHICYADKLNSMLMSMCLESLRQRHPPYASACNPDAVEVTDHKVS